MNPSRTMRRRAGTSRVGRRVLEIVLVLALEALGCGSGSDYYFVNELKGEGDTLLLRFIYTCGVIDLTWDGSFVGQPNFRAELVVNHDDLGGDCHEDPRDVTFDVGPMKRSFRVD